MEAHLSEASSHRFDVWTEAVYECEHMCVLMGMSVHIFISECPVMMPAIKSISGAMLIMHQSRALRKTCSLVFNKLL